MDIGSVIKEQYKVIEHIGRGGMADVWSARDTRLRRLVAIKTIAKGLSADVDPVALFEKEAQTIAAMEHPHILPIYDFGEFEGSLYIVMRFVTGGSLENLLRAGPMDVQDVLKMGENIARALDYAHENNIIHLDLKPPNILLGTQATPYLADFGLATVLDVEGRARNPGSGTLLYMAPEQIVAEVIDHRADIYSFTIMLYHMLTSRLPFDGTAPLALMQLQTGRTIPDITNFVPTLPESVNEILRHGTAQNPADRPKTLSELMEDFRSVVAATSTIEFPATVLNLDDTGPALSMKTQRFVNEGAQELLEAVDVYSRARQQWAGGQGRFTLGMSPYLLISGYYQDAVHYDLHIDESGYEMLLRGALEYDTDIDHWWSKLDDNSRREVCLHTLRSLNIPARIRALDRLEGLKDDGTNPVIPRLIGQALEIERNEDVQVAALRVLRSRARMMPRRVKVEAPQNVWMQSMTRLGVQLVATADWPDSIYTPEIDTLIAETALDTDAPRVAEFAARTVGRIRSLAAIQHISKAQIEGRRGALQALAFIRDEAPALPNVVSRQGRLYAWITNTARRLTDRPLEGILRFVLVLLGGWIGMGEMVYTIFRSQALFTAQRWANALSIGLVFGLFLALTVLLADEFSRRLERFWQGWLRLLLFGAFGYLMGTITWGAFTWMYFNYTPPWDIMRLAGGGLALGLVLAALLQLRGIPAVAFTTLSAYLPMYVMHRSFYFGDYTSVTPAVPLGLVWGGVIGWLIRRRVAAVTYGPNSAARPKGTGWRSRMRTVIDIPKWPDWARVLLAGLGGAGFTAATWMFIGRTYESFPQGSSSLTWDGVIALFMVSLIIGAIMSYASRTAPRIAFFAVALVALFAMELTAGRYFYDDAFQSLNPVAWNAPLYNTIPFAPQPNAPIIYFDQPQIRNQMIIVTTLPMVLAFALGTYAVLIWRDTWHYVGAPHAAYERGGWLTAVLIYGLIATAAVGVFALFSMHVSLLWGLVWSLWGFATWLFLVATWRWALWGAQGVVASVLLLLAGGFAADLFDTILAVQAGLVPPLQQMVAVTLHPGPQSTLVEVISTAPVLWVLWGFALVLSLRSAGQRKFWGYAGTVALAMIFALAIVLSRLPFPSGESASLSAEGYRLFSLDWVAGVPALTIQVSFFWGLWSLALLAMMYGVRYRQLWSGIVLVGLIVGWFVVVLFGGIAGSYAVLAATHAGLVIYALQPEWAKMEPNRFRLPWIGGAPTDGTLRMPAIPVIEVEAPAQPALPSSPAKPQYAGPTILRDTPIQLSTQASLPTRLTTSEYNAVRDAEFHTRAMPTMQFPLPPTEVVVDEEKAAGLYEGDTETLQTAPSPSDAPDLKTQLDPNVHRGDPHKMPGEFPRVKLGQTGPLPSESTKPPVVPRIRLDTSSDKAHLADTIPPTGKPLGVPKAGDELPTAESLDLHNAQTQALPPDLKPERGHFSGDEPPTMESLDLHNAQTQAAPADFKPSTPANPMDSGPTIIPGSQPGLPIENAGPTRPKIKMGTGPLTPPDSVATPVPPETPDAGARPKIKIGTGPLQSPPETPDAGARPKIKMGTGPLQSPPPEPSASGQTGFPKIKLGGESQPPTSESGPTGTPKIKLGDLSQPNPATDPLSTGDPNVPGIKISLNQMGKPAEPPPSGFPKIKLEGDASKTPPSPPPTMPVPPELKQSLQKKDDIEDGEFEELPPDEE